MIQRTARSTSWRSQCWSFLNPSSVGIVDRLASSACVQFPLNAFDSEEVPSWGSRWYQLDRYLPWSWTELLVFRVFSGIPWRSLLHESIGSHEPDHQSSWWYRSPYQCHQRCTWLMVVKSQASVQDGFASANACGTSYEACLGLSTHHCSRSHSCHAPFHHRCSLHTLGRKFLP